MHLNFILLFVFGEFRRHTGQWMDRNGMQMWIPPVKYLSFPYSGSEERSSVYWNFLYVCLSMARSFLKSERAARRVIPRYCDIWYIPMFSANARLIPLKAVGGQT